MRARRELRLALLAAAVLAGLYWIASVRTGAHLFHFDAKAHLVVARRTMDSLTPGWTQLGAIWLPLPHILNALPAQLDSLYTTGIAGSLLSFGFFVLALGALGQAAYWATGDVRAGVVALAVPGLNPGWLYLQSTPLIEGLFLGLVSLTIAMLVLWHQTGKRSALFLATGASALSCWVRYEAWPVTTVAVLVIVALSPRVERRRVALWGLGLGVVAPILLYGLHSYVATGIPFYVIGSENLTERRGDVLHAMALCMGGVRDAFGLPLLFAGIAATVWLASSAARALKPLPGLALAGAMPMAVTLTAYIAGHPQKARYALLAVPGLALALAAASAGRPRLQTAALALAAFQVVSVPAPLPVLREAMRDRRDVLEREPVLAAWRAEYAGGHILASMGSLAPVLFEMGQLGVPLREFVHEGNGNWWEYAVVDPGREVRWIMIAPGDILDQERQLRHGYPQGFVPAFRFGRVVVYRRMETMTRLTADDAGRR
jgi:hypothetical protein